MKRTFIFLIILLSAIYAKQGYEFLTADGSNSCLLSGKLSDIAEQVIAIPLQTNKGYSIPNAKQVRKEGDNLFLICNETIYRFNGKGELLNAITDPEIIKVGGYIIDKRSQQLIAFGNEDDIHYYTFDGKLIETKKLRSNFSQKKIYSADMHHGEIWTTEEQITYHPDTNKTSIDVMAVKYDHSFTQLDSKKIISANTENNQSLPSYRGSELCVHQDTGNLYLYNPPLTADYLLIDTLSFINHGQPTDNNYVTAFPIRMGQRFWLAACEQNMGSLSNYLFCYDTHKNRAWELKEGFEDDFYKTGNITNLHSLGLGNPNYYFCKSGKDLENAFPHAANDSLVVFIVKLKA